MKPYVAIGSRNRTLLTGFGVVHSYLRKVTGTDCQIEKVLDAANGYAVNLCHETSDRNRIRILMEKEVREGKYTQAFFDAIDKEYKDDLVDIKAFAKQDITKLSSEELIKNFNTFYEIYISTIHPMVLGIYASDLQDVFEKELKVIVAASGGGELSSDEVIKHTAMLLSPTRLTTVQKEEQGLFELEDAFEKTYPLTEQKTKENFESFCNDPKVEKAYETLADSYGWFHMEYIGEPRTIDQYREQVWNRIADLAKAGVKWETQVSPKDRLKSILREQDEFFTRNAKHPSIEFFKKLVFAMQEYQIVLDYSKADLIEGIFYARPLLAEIGKRVGMDSWIDVRFLTPDEIRAFLKGGKTVTFEYIAERKKHWACLLEDGKVSVYFGDDAVQIMDKLIEKPEIGNTKEFKGMTAYPGLVRGTACVVRGAQDREKFKQGQIMVTHDTTTELTSIIKMSRAIVADYGSLLSHTAIVSREFKIPCLVNTKMGTKLVKDGDELEVDASNGIVRIISTN